MPPSTAPRWPLQSQMRAYYGNPDADNNGAPDPKWEAQNLVNIPAAQLPFVIRYAGKPVRSIRCHKLVRDAFLRVLNKIWIASGRSQALIDAWGMSDYNGCYAFRTKRAGSSLSTHAYGCAFDFNAARNGFRDPTPHFAKVPQVLRAWASEGAVWGGPWRPNADGMHWQFARLG